MSSDEITDEELEEVSGVEFPQSMKVSADLDGSEPEEKPQPGEEAGRFAGGYLAMMLFYPFGFLGGILWGVVGKLPGRSKVYAKMIKAGYRAMYKKTGAHLVVNTVYEDGEMVPRPAKINDEGNVETTNGEEWTLEKGLQYVRVGDAPVATGVTDQHELVDPIAARIAEAVDLSPRRYRTVKQTGEGYLPVDYLDPLAAEDDGAGPQTAVTDGGVTSGLGFTKLLDEVASGDLEIESANEQLLGIAARLRQLGRNEGDSSGVVELSPSSTFDDIWVDARNPEPENDGWIVSMAKAYELHWDQAGSEEMRNQEIRGRLSELDPTGNKKEKLIQMLLLFGAFALGMFGPALASTIAGGSGGVSLPEIGLSLGVL